MIRFKDKQEFLDEENKENQKPSTFPPGKGDDQIILHDRNETTDGETKSENRKKKEFACTLCDKKFGQKSNLSTHIETAHDPEVEKYCPGPKPPKRVKPPLETLEEREESIKASLGKNYKVVTYFRCFLCEEKFEDGELIKYQTHLNTSCPERNYE